MDDGDRLAKLLEEVRDTQREHLAEYRRVTRELLELQQRAATRQAQIGALYRRFILGGAVLVAALLILLVFLLVRWGPHLFRR
jgi:ferric-dicitrate binding protein FerR (iron transport regulator)